MTDSGYDFAFWTEAVAKYAPEPDDTSAPSQAEVAQAVADATCRATTKLEPRLFDAESRILSKKLEDNAQLVSDFEERVSEAVARAQATVAESGH